ncbi:hypothetical protein PENARI_c028G06993 [Penicillium arizonense]|uniref:Uncharacterized protein n=1 Tax=Penicillium arizonense TaxID=1835702 RepID=A0A1F5L5E1_PENAI|nr:hypothetical protein PENARI_c028G06993 [Penicillium arizonense]OGE48435.1 hypothetical protein PENARI_c028G06993 [Penicillium arizonense]
METRTEYAQRPSTRQSRMKIDALLNPGEGDSYSDSPRSQHASIPSIHSYQHSPSFPPSPNYWYGRYHDTSPGALSSATHSSSHSHSESQSQGQSQTHHMFLTYRPSNQMSTNPNSARHHSTSNQGSVSGPGSRSTNSSPDPYHPQSRERYDSVSSSSSANADRRRPPRPKYEEEEMYFIWYHRVDLCQEWKEVREAFNRQFPDRQRRGFQGIQCKFYRFIKEKKCPTLREQRRMRDGEFLREGTSVQGGTESGAPRFGVIEWGKVWYPWMRESRAEVLRL